MIKIDELPIGEEYKDEDGMDYILLQEMGLGTGIYMAVQKSDYINPTYLVLVKKK